MITGREFVFKVGLFAIGLDTYWDQFPGLRERLSENLQLVNQKIEDFGATVVNVGLVDTPQKAMDAGHALRCADVDIIFLYVSTYALSATVLPVVQRAKIPVIILNLSPSRAIDYTRFNALPSRSAMTGEWLAYCSACPVPEIANVFRRCNICFHEVTGTLDDDDPCWTEIREWVDAASVLHKLQHNTLGAMGNYYPGMLDIYSDLTLQLATFGGHIQIIEVDELSALCKQVNEDQIKGRVEEFRKIFDIQKECSLAELQKAARTSIALDRIVSKYGLGSLAYYYKGMPGSDNEETISSIILGTSVLTARGIPVAGEYEIKNAQAMKIMDSFGAGGSFSEYYAIDFDADVVLMGHDGPGHIAICDEKTKVRQLGLYHGKAGSGLSVEMRVKTGPVTCLSVVEKKGKVYFLLAEGETVPGPILEIGNTNSRYKFATGARQFVNDWNTLGPAHHSAIGIGHIGSRIIKLAKLLGIECFRVG
jgi:L-arabinose isomerase